jgi:hypothetical protein
MKPQVSDLLAATERVLIRERDQTRSAGQHGRADRRDQGRVEVGVSDQSVAPSANRAERRVWPKRRQWLDRITTDCRLTSGAKSWLLLLASRSDDAGKPVWGNQVRMGERIGRCERSVRRYRAEAETLGYVAVYRSKPQRGPSGRWSRRKANAYYLRIPPTSTTTVGAPRRRQRAGYCVIASHHPTGRSRLAPRPQQHGVCVLADSDGRSSPLRGAPTGAAPAINTSGSLMNWDKPSETERTAVATLIAELKAGLHRPRR